MSTISPQPSKHDFAPAPTLSLPLPPPTASGAPPTATPPFAPSLADASPRVPSFYTGKSRHLVTGGLSVLGLGYGGVAYSMDPAHGLDPTSPLVLAPVLTLAGQALMALIGYLRDYGAEKMEAEKQRTSEAQRRAEAAEAHARQLQEEIARRDAREDEAREAENRRLLARIEKMEQERAAR